MPGLPGAACSSVSDGDWVSFQASACSRPPDPTRRTFTRPSLFRGGRARRGAAARCLDAPSGAREGCAMAEGAQTFRVSDTAYDSYMGRYSDPLARELLRAAGVEPGQRALDVGCGPGALTAALVSALGPGSVAAVDPSEPFVEACRRRNPGVEVRAGAAESLPFPDPSFDAVLAQLVVQFMSDAPSGVREMRRVARPGGVLAACTWDYGDGMTMLRTFWSAAQ